MKTLPVFFLLFANLVFAQFGQIKESLTIDSKILKRKVEYSIYLPAGYDATDRKYPVLYLLHGYGDDESGWTQFGEVQHIADKAISTGEATPMIIAMPDGGVTFYINSVDGKVLYEDFFINEFIPFIESAYRIRKEKRYRAIAGLSMGGHGTLIMAFKHPELFSAAAPLSAAAWTKEELIAMPKEQWDPFFGSLFGQGEGEARISEHLRKNSAVFLVEDGDAEKLKTVRYYIDCGDKDFLIKGNMALHAAMIDKGIPHEFRVRDGVHDWDYWRTSLPEVLAFISKSFHQ